MEKNTLYTSARVGLFLGISAVSVAILTGSAYYAYQTANSASKQDGSLACTFAALTVDGANPHYDDGISYKVRTSLNCSDGKPHTLSDFDFAAKKESSGYSKPVLMGRDNSFECPRYHWIGPVLQGWSINPHGQWVTYGTCTKTS